MAKKKLEETSTETSTKTKYEFEKHKIKEVKTHQAIRFEGSSVDNFSTYKRPGKTHALSIKLVEGRNVVEVIGPTDIILIPLVNVANIILKDKRDNK